MKRTYHQIAQSICFAACTIISAADAAPIVVRTVENPMNGHIYHLLRGDGGESQEVADLGVSWTDAEAEAIELGGHLVAINEPFERLWLASTFLASFDERGIGRDFYVWTGLNDVAIEGEFVWSNGDPLTFEAWSGGEPNDYDGGEDYVHIYNWLDGQFRWNDNKNITATEGGFPFSAIAEIVPVPEPASWLIACVALFSLLTGVRRSAR